MVEVTVIKIAKLEVCRSEKNSNLTSKWKKQRQQAVPAALVLWYAHACFRAIVLVMFLSAILVVLKTAVEVLSL